MPATIRAMALFVRAVEHNSFVTAARSLLVDPTVVSRTISALEKDLGVLLFVRSTRNLKLTAEGMRFYQDCVQVLQKFNEATRRFWADRSLPQGLLRVGMAPAVRRRLLLQVIPRFQQEYPQIAIDLISIDDRGELGEKGIDVLIRGRGTRQRGGARSEPQGLVARKLFQSKYAVAASQEYLNRAGAPRTPADLLQHSCIAHVSLEHDVGDEWEFVKSTERQKIKFPPKLRIQGVDAVCEAGIAGCGVISLLAASIEDELRSRKLVAVLPDWERTGARPIFAIYRKTVPVVPQVNAFVRYLVDAYRRYDLADRRQKEGH